MGDPKGGPRGEWGPRRRRRSGNYFRVYLDNPIQVTILLWEMQKTALMMLNVSDVLSYYYKFLSVIIKGIINKGQSNAI